MNGTLSAAPRDSRSSFSSVLKRATGTLALGALVALAQTVALATPAPAGDSHFAGISGVRRVAAAPADATAAPSPAGASVPSAGAIHDRAGGKPVVILYDSSSWTGQFLGIAQGVAESAQDFATKFGHRFNVETTVVAATGKGSKELDDAMKASGALLGAFYHASVRGSPRHKTTDWTFALGTKLRDAAGTPWIEAKKDADQNYPALSDYHAITLSHLLDLNDQVIDGLAKEAAK
jgi:hypothetical protein